VSIGLLGPVAKQTFRSKGDFSDPLRKPPELHALIENFCLGTRRLEIFGRASSLRRGWVTAGDIDDAAFELEKVGGRIWERESYEEEVGRMRDAATGKCVVATSPGPSWLVSCLHVLTNSILCRD